MHLQADGDGTPRHSAPPGPAPRAIDKWALLRELSCARRAFGLSDRDLGVLQVLLSFRPGPTLASERAGDLVVHPSNRAICERLNGMPCSTMRRHLAALVDAGVILRRDSPNGKRYARRYGAEKIAYGFDLAPLVARSAEIVAAAEALRTEAVHRDHARERISLMRRDLAGLAAYGAETAPTLPLWPDLALLATDAARRLRRVLTLADLSRLEEVLAEALGTAKSALGGVSIGVETGPETAEPGTSDARNEHHHQRSNIESIDSEEGHEMVDAASVRPDPDRTTADQPVDRSSTLPLSLVMDACPEIAIYHDPSGSTRVRHWHHLVQAADRIRPMLGIGIDVWNAAKSAMGPEPAAMVLAAMLERVSEIRSPGAYLRTLSARAAAGRFSAGSMILALLRGRSAAGSQL